MSFEGEQKDQSGGALAVWEAERYLRSVAADEARLSRGFMRSQPGKWFPGLSAHWLPLTHSLGIELKVIEVKPVVQVPAGFDHSFVASIDDEYVGIGIDFDTARALLDVVVPGSNRASHSIVLEYLARRLFTSLGLCWSGPESAAVRFDSSQSHSVINPAGGVKLTLHVNGKNCEVWLTMGRILVETLDALWRRQVQSSTQPGVGAQTVHVEVVRLAVPPSMLSEYLKQGTVIDLEVPITDQVHLRTSTGPWIQARLCNVEGRLGCEALPGPAASKSQPDGTTALHIQFGSAELQSQQMAELGQFGAIWDTGIPLGSTVQLVINDEVVGSGTLCTYEGRFAVSVNAA